MALILAIDPDKRQSTQLAAVVRTALGAELIQRGTAHEALAALEGRVPDLVLTSSLMSPREDAALAAHLRELGAAAAHVQTVTIPLLGAAAPQRARGMLAALRREKPQPVMTDGCDPAVFAEQVRQYLTTAEEQKAHPPARRTDLRVTAAHSAGFDSVAAAPAADATSGFDSQTDASYDAYIAEPVTSPFADPLAQPESPWAEPAEALTGLEAASFVAGGIETERDTRLFEPAIEGDAQTDAILGDIEEPASLDELLDTADDRTAVPTIELPADAPVAFQDFSHLTDPATVETDLTDDTHRAQFQDVRTDPVAAHALEELSRLAPAPSLHDGIPAEAPVPVVEMHAFQSLDDIANELAAGPRRKPKPAFESLDDLASLFAARPSPARRKPQDEVDLYTGPAPEVDLTAMAMRDDSGGFDSLFAKPSAPVAEETSSLVLGIDPSLFATPPPRARASRAHAPAWESAPIAATPEPVFVEPVFVEPVFAEPVFAEPAHAEPVYAEPIFVDAIAAAPVSTVEEPFFAEAALVEPHVDPAVAEPVFVQPPQAEPELFEPFRSEHAFLGSTVPEPITTEPVSPEPAVPELEAEPILVEAALPEPDFAESVATAVAAPSGESMPVADTAPVAALAPVVDEPLTIEEPLTLATTAPVSVLEAATLDVEPLIIEPAPAMTLAVAQDTVEACVVEPEPLVALVDEPEIVSAAVVHEPEPEPLVAVADVSAVAIDDLIATAAVEVAPAVDAAIEPAFEPASAAFALEPDVDPAPLYAGVATEPAGTELLGDGVADVPLPAATWELEQSIPAFATSDPVDADAAVIETSSWELEQSGPIAGVTEAPSSVDGSLGDQLDRAAAALPAEPVAATRPFEDFDPFEEIVVDFTLVDEPDPMAVATAPPEALPPPAVAAAPAAPFAFNFVDSFGDELADFLNPPEETITISNSGPMLDAEALSLIGDAALKASLDALVIEEFGGTRQARKAPAAGHAGGTPVAPADRKGRKRPVQDEWGIFDPEQCGFAALEEDEKHDASPNAHVRVITY